MEQVEVPIEWAAAAEEHTAAEDVLVGEVAEEEGSFEVFAEL